MIEYKAKPENSSNAVIPVRSETASRSEQRHLWIRKALRVFLKAL